MKKYYNRFPQNLNYINNWFDVWAIAGGSLIDTTKTHIKLLFILPNGKEEYKINLKFLLSKVNQEIRESNLIHHRSAKVEMKRLDPSKYKIVIPESESKKYEFINWEQILKDIEDNEKEMDNNK